MTAFWNVVLQSFAQNSLKVRKMSIFLLCLATVFTFQPWNDFYCCFAFLGFSQHCNTASPDRDRAPSHEVANLCTMKYRIVWSPGILLHLGLGNNRSYIYRRYNLPNKIIPLGTQSSDHLVEICTIAFQTSTQLWRPAFWYCHSDIEPA